MNKENPETLYISFQRVTKINSTLFAIFRQTYEAATPGEYHFYLELFNLHQSFFALFGIEQHYKLKAQHNDYEATARALHKVINESQKVCNLLKIHCLDDHLEDLQKIELKLILIMRDMHRDTSAARILAREVDTLKTQIHNL
jgi:hypothetical protein